ncbi:MAG: hypothetical protein LLG02_05065 [Pelosinus sp.]|nr:hypothetical protein [Pelosinus sp.]
MSTISSYAPSTTSYNKAINNTQMAMLKIATAKKINSAADDAATLAISQGMQGQINGLAQAYDNTGSATSLLNTAEGAMSSTTDVMQQMRTLSVEAANGTLTDTDRAAIQQQMTQLSAQVNTNAANTEFNGMPLNNGTFSGQFQTGANSGQNDNVSIVNTSSAALGINNPDVTTQAAAENMISAMDNSINQVSSSRAYLGAQTNGLDYTASDVNQTAANLQSAQAKYTDTDMTAALISLNQSKIQAYVSTMALKNSFGLQQSTISLVV